MTLYVGEFRSLLLNNCVTNDMNGKEIKMRCTDCGKHFWVQVLTVAWNEKHGRITKCSACSGKMLPVVKKVRNSICRERSMIK